MFHSTVGELWVTRMHYTLHKTLKAWTWQAADMEVDWGRAGANHLILGSLGFKHMSRHCTVSHKSLQGLQVNGNFEEIKKKLLPLTTLTLFKDYSLVCKVCINLSWSICLQAHS